MWSILPCCSKLCTRIRSYRRYWNTPADFYITYRISAHPACQSNSLFSCAHTNSCFLNIRLISQTRPMLFLALLFLNFLLQPVSDYACLPLTLAFYLSLFLILPVNCVQCSGSILFLNPSEMFISPCRVLW